MSNNSFVDFGFDLPEHARSVPIAFLKKKFARTHATNQQHFGTMGEQASWDFIESLV
jgi:hypothetical protein